MPHDNHRANGIKISDFPSAPIQNSDQLTFIGNGINYRVTFSGFKDSLGVTGTIQQAGPATATPVLDKQATDNFIRNLVNGSGFKASIDPENGIVLDHNFTVGAVGNPIMLNSASESPIMPSLIDGTGISIAAGTDSYTISATGATTPTNTVIINQESDFPVQDTETITLSAKTRFVIGATFETGKRFIVGDGAVITMENQFGDTLTYTGTGDMLTSVDAGFTIEKISIDSPNAAQTFNMSDSTGSKVLTIQSVTVVSTPKWGTYDGFISTFTEFSNCPAAAGGLTITGSGQLITGITQFALISSGPVLNHVDLGAAVIPNIEMDNLITIAPAGSFQVSGAPANGNVPAGQVAMLANSSVAGGAVQLDGISEDDFRWSFSSNSGIADTHPDGKLSFSGNALATTILSPDTPVKINAVWTIGADSHFTGDSTGRVTYNGERPFTAPIAISVTALMLSGGDKQVTPYVTINGTPVDDSGVQLTASSVKAGAATLVWQHDFQSGDYVELWAEVNNNTEDIIVQQSVMLVN